MIFRRFFAFLIDKTIIIIIITGILGFFIRLVIGAFVQGAKQEYFENAFIIICFLSIPFYYSKTYAMSKKVINYSGVSHLRKISCNILILTHLKGIKIA